MGDTSFGDVAYRVYVTALATLFVVFTASGWIGDAPVGADTTARILRDAPAWLGLAAAVGVLGGVRVGSRGGPLAVEAADVHHVLMAPIERRLALRRPVLRALGSAVLWGALTGGLAGHLASQRLPHTAMPWIASGALATATAAALGVGAALLVAGRSVPRVVPFAIALALVAWSVADVADRGVTAPFTYLGRMALWPLRFDPRGLLLTAAAVPLAAFAHHRIGGLSMEAARRRTVLIGQLRFAVTQQDLRTVLVLRRQLANEVMRRQPWLPSLPRRAADAWPVFARGLQSFGRWPVIRIARVGSLGIVIGLALRGVWSGTTPLVIVAGVAAYVAALDAIEPLAQDLDRPTRLTSYPRPRGWVLVRHLAAPTLAMLAVGVVALLTAFVVDPAGQVVRLGAIELLPGALAAVAAAAVSVVSEPILDSAAEAMIPPEVAGPRALLRVAWPPALAVGGMLPVVAARHAAETATDTTAALASAGVAVVALAAVVAGWVRFRDDIHAALRPKDVRAS